MPAMAKRGRGGTCGGVDPRLVVRLPAGTVARLAFVPLLDGRPVVEWARAVVLEALGRLLLERPGWAWARPGAPWWREGAEGAPAGALAGGERIMVLATLPGRFEDEEGDGFGLLVDVVPADEGPAGRLLRRVELRAVDVLPWKVRRSEPIPAGSPGAEAAARKARRQAEGRTAWQRAKAGGPPVDPGSSMV